MVQVKKKALCSKNKNFFGKTVIAHGVMVMVVWGGENKKPGTKKSVRKPLYKKQKKTVNPGTHF